MNEFKIEKCGDCACMDDTEFCMSRHEQRPRWCSACGWAESFSGDALTVAKDIWEELGFVPVKEDGDTIDHDWENPILGWYFVGDSRLEIWHDIEERTGVSVAYLMGEAKNPDGTDKTDGPNEFKPVTIDGKTAKEMYDTICWAHEEYADEDRREWWDVDDELQELAWRLEELITKAQEG